jgi:hypothetical protein
MRLEEGRELMHSVGPPVSTTRRELAKPERPQAAEDNSASATPVVAGSGLGTTATAGSDGIAST